MTRIRRLERVTKVIPNGPFSYSRTLPNSNPTSTFVIACIDPRFAYALEQYLDQTYAQGGSSYDLFILAGASMGGNLTGNTATPPPGNTVPTCAIVSSGNNWRVALKNHIQVAITLHNVTEIVIIDHLNCGAYVACNGATGGDQNRQLHEDQFDALKAYINGESFFENTTGTAALGSVIFTTITGYYFDGVAADDSTNMRNIADGTLRNPPIIQPKGTNSGAKVLVLGCIDPRYSAVMTSFLTQYKGVQFIYDLFILAGASLGANQSYTTLSAFPTPRAVGNRGSYPNNVLADDAIGIGNLGRSWGPTFFDHLSVARLLHNITEVWVFDHLDCGAYKLILSGTLNAFDNTNAPHITEMEKLKTFIDKYTSGNDPLNTSPYSLAFKGFIIGQTGIIENVINSEYGTKIETNWFGSSRIRNPASTQTDLMAFKRADYITQVQPLDMTANKNTTGISQQNLTELCGCSSKTLLPRDTICRT